MKKLSAITDVPGLKVGHSSDFKALTGCTVILCQEGAIGIIATNANLTKRAAYQVAQIAHSGLAKTISPLHSTFDGDLIFAISYGKKKADVDTVGLLGEAALIESVETAIIKADGFGIVPAYRDIQK